MTARTLGFAFLVAGLVVGPGLAAGSSTATPAGIAPGPTPADLGDAPAIGGVQPQEDEDEDEEGRGLLPEWWGLGGEADEAPYVGLAELGVTLLAVGVGGYSAGKRLDLVPPRHRRRLLQAHEWTVLVGVALTVPHFALVEEWEGLGLLAGILLGVEVASGVYGRHLHRHVVRLGRGEETPAVLGRALALSKRVLFRRWRRVHVSLTLLTALVVLLHVLTAVGD